MIELKKPIIYNEKVTIRMPTRTPLIGKLVQKKYVTTKQKVAGLQPEQNINRNSFKLAHVAWIFLKTCDI
jgi:hypothetical protein